MSDISRRAACATFLLGWPALARSQPSLPPSPAPSPAPAPPLVFAAAGEGSAFLPYARAVAPVLAAALGAPVEPRATAGSIENIGLIEASPTTIGTVFLGSAFDALGGAGFAAGRRFTQLRALFPMYETSFQAAALRSSGIATIAGLDGRRVGVGPANGPAELYFRTLAAEARISPRIVNGAPAELARQLAEGGIDALWQGAVVPVPALVDAGARADVVVFGLTEAEVAAMRRRHPFLAEAEVAPGAYRGQTAPIRSVAAWNFVLAHAELPDDVAYRLTRAALTDAGLAARLPAAKGTTAANAATNTIVPFHPGAARYFREAGVALP